MNSGTVRPEKQAIKVDTAIISNIHSSKWRRKKKKNHKTAEQRMDTIRWIKRTLFKSEDQNSLVCAMPYPLVLSTAEATASLVSTN